MASTLPFSSLLGIHIVISSKAYWDGATQSCVPRERGGCCHIWTDKLIGPGQIAGDFEKANGILILSISGTKALDKATFDKFFQNGKFILDGPLTFSPEVLSKLELQGNYTIPAGSYAYNISGDLITVTFK